MNRKGEVDTAVVVVVVVFLALVGAAAFYWVNSASLSAPVATSHSRSLTITPVVVDPSAIGEETQGSESEAAGQGVGKEASEEEDESLME